MNTVINDEIASMMSMLKSPLREAWERKHLQGRTLEGIKKMFTVSEKKYKQFRRLTWCALEVLMLGFVVLLIWIFKHMPIVNRFILKDFWIDMLFPISTVLGALGASLTLFSVRKLEKFEKINSQCREALAKLQKHLVVLCPYWHYKVNLVPIDALFVKENLISLAQHILAHKEMFEKLRMDLMCDRESLMKQCKRIDFSEANFDNAWETLKEFDLSFDKTSIFKLAEELLVKEVKR